MDTLAAICISLGLLLLLGSLFAGAVDRARDEGARETGALLRKLCDQCPKGSYARDAYEFVLDDFQKAANNGND